MLMESALVLEQLASVHCFLLILLVEVNRLSLLLLAFF